MRKTLILFFSLWNSITFATNASNAEKYLYKRIQVHDKRYGSFLFCLKLLQERNAQVLVETGTARYGESGYWGDGGSTVIFGQWAFDHHVQLYSVDISFKAINIAKQATEAYAENIHFMLGNSIEFLKDFNQLIDFLYLDSFDFDYNDPDPSQQHHLREIVAAYPNLHKNSVIMIDDCYLPHGGKGKLVIEFLLSKGWEVLYDGYQTILSQKKGG